MRDQHDLRSGEAQLVDRPQAAALKARVADGQHFVHEKNPRLAVDRDGEPRR
jgi:hypothetical protein